MRKILIVASKFPPEYSGPGVRIPKLYDKISKEINISNIYVYCNSAEFSKNKNYLYKSYPVRRRVVAFVKSKTNRFSRTIHHLFETIQALWELKFYNNKNINMVHIIGHSGGTAAAIYWAKIHKIPVMMELVNADSVPLQRFLLVRMLKPFPPFVIVAISNTIKEKAIKLGIERKNIWCRPNPVDESAFFPDLENKNSYRESLGLFKAEDIVMLSIAKFIPRKNQIFLLDIVAQLPEKYKLILAGPIIQDGFLQGRDIFYIDEIKNKIKDLKLSDRVILITNYVDSAKYLKASDLYLLPGVKEGLGTPMLESIASSVPVIASAEPAFKEWITDGINGYICDFNIETWVNNIKKAMLISKKQKLEQAHDIIQKCGHTHINKNYIKWIKKITK